MSGGFTLWLGLLPATAREERDLSREWKSKDGRYQVEASFVSYNSRTGKVTLRRKDSTPIVVVLSQLSAPDQAFVKEQNEVTRHPAKEVRRYGITWQPEIEDALARAADSAKKRPVMWFRVLGKLEDGM